MLIIVKPSTMNRKRRREINNRNSSRSSLFIKVPKEEWPQVDGKRNSGRFQVLVNKHFLVQLFAEHNQIIRMSVNRTQIDSNGHWKDGITWDELQDIKLRVGYGDSFAVEAYPETLNVVNVAPMRHLFILPERPDWAWSN